MLLVFGLVGCVSGRPRKEASAPRPLNGYLTDAAGCALYFGGWDYPLDFTWNGPCRRVTLDGQSYQLAHGRGRLEIRRHGSDQVVFVYEGEVKNGRYDGQGREWVDRGQGLTPDYEGQWRADRVTGRGRQIYDNGDVYEGQFKNGFRHGQGTYLYQGSGGKYVGQWREGRREGQGVHYQQPGSGCGEYAKYAGGLKRDLLHGWGTKYDAQGRIIRRGLWFEGCPYEDSPAQWSAADREARRKEGREAYRLLSTDGPLSLMSLGTETGDLVLVLPAGAQNGRLVDRRGRIYEAREQELTITPDAPATTRPVVTVEHFQGPEVFTLQYLLYGEPMVLKFQALSPVRLSVVW